LQRVRAKVGDPVRKVKMSWCWSHCVRRRWIPQPGRAAAGATAAEASLNASIERESAGAADADYIEKRLERLKNYMPKVLCQRSVDQIEAETKRRGPASVPLKRR